MKIGIIIEDGFYVIKIYTKRATLQEQNSLIKKIPSLFEEVKKIIETKKKIKKLLEDNNMSLKSIDSVEENFYENSRCK